MATFKNLVREEEDRKRKAQILTPASITTAPIGTQPEGSGVFQGGQPVAKSSQTGVVVWGKGYTRLTERSQAAQANDEKFAATQRALDAGNMKQAQEAFPKPEELDLQINTEIAQAENKAFLNSLSSQKVQNRIAVPSIGGIRRGSTVRPGEDGVQYEQARRPVALFNPQRIRMEQAARNSRIDSYASRGLTFLGVGSDVAGRSGSRGRVSLGAPTESVVSADRLAQVAQAANDLIAGRRREGGLTNDEIAASFSPTAAEINALLSSSAGTSAANELRRILSEKRDQLVDDFVRKVPDFKSVSEAQNAVNAVKIFENPIVASVVGDMLQSMINPGTDVNKQLEDRDQAIQKDLNDRELVEIRAKQEASTAAIREQQRNERERADAEAAVAKNYSESGSSIPKDEWININTEYNDKMVRVYRSPEDRKERQNAYLTKRALATHSGDISDYTILNDKDAKEQFFASSYATPEVKALARAVETITKSSGEDPLVLNEDKGRFNPLREAMAKWKEELANGRDEAISALKSFNDAYDNRSYINDPRFSPDINVASSNEGPEYLDKLTLAIMERDLPQNDFISGQMEDIRKNPDTGIAGSGVAPELQAAFNNIRSQLQRDIEQKQAIDAKALLDNRAKKAELAMRQKQTADEYFKLNPEGAGNIRANEIVFLEVPELGVEKPFRNQEVANLWQMAVTAEKDPQVKEENMKLFLENSNYIVGDNKEALDSALSSRTELVSTPRGTVTRYNFNPIPNGGALYGDKLSSMEGVYRRNPDPAYKAAIAGDFQSWSTFTYGGNVPNSVRQAIVAGDKMLKDDPNKFYESIYGLAGYEIPQPGDIDATGTKPLKNVPGGEAVANAIIRNLSQDGVKEAIDSGHFDVAAMLAIAYERSGIINEMSSSVANETKKLSDIAFGLGDELARVEGYHPYGEELKYASSFENPSSLDLLTSYSNMINTMIDDLKNDPTYLNGDIIRTEEERLEHIQSALTQAKTNLATAAEKAIKDADALEFVATSGPDRKAAPLGYGQSERKIYFRDGTEAVQPVAGPAQMIGQLDEMINRIKRFKDWAADNQEEAPVANPITNSRRPGS